MSRLAWEEQRPLLEGLNTQKQAETGAAQDLDWDFHDQQLQELEALLDRAYQESSLPEERDRQAIHEFLVEVRLG